MFIHLTRKFDRLSAEGLKKVEEYVSKEIEETDSSGPSLKWFEEQGLKPPEELRESEMVLKIESDLEEATSLYLCNVQMVESFEEDGDHTIITYDSGKEVEVVEKLETIIEKIKRNGI